MHSPTLLQLLLALENHTSATIAIAESETTRRQTSISPLCYFLIGFVEHLLLATSKQGGYFDGKQSQCQNA